MLDWISDHMALSWVGAATALAVVELLSLDLVLLMFAVGALAAALSVVLGASGAISIAVFAVVSALGLVVLRPSLVARLHAGPTLTQGHDALVGRTAVVAEPVTRDGGRVRVNGEVWSARTIDASGIEPGTDVVIVAIDGATAVVTAALEA